MKHRNMWTYLFVLGALLLTSVGDAAAQTVPLANAYTAIGRFNDNQTWLVSYNFNTGQCAWTTVGGANGLNGNVQINGRIGNDFIFIVGTPGTHCPTLANMNPPITNGWTISINAGGSDDAVDGGFTAGTRLGGDSGNDLVTTRGSNVQLWGWTGNDTMYGSWGSTVRGEDGNDTMCTNNNATVNQFIGGSGSDTYCGNWTLFPSSATANCGGC